MLFRSGQLVLARGSWASVATWFEDPDASVTLPLFLMQQRKPFTSSSPNPDYSPLLTSMYIIKPLSYFSSESHSAHDLGGV